MAKDKKIIAKEIVSQAILLNNFDFFMDRIEQSTGNMIKLIDTICPSAIPVISKEITKLKSQIKKDFSQLKSDDKINKREIIPVEEKTWSVYKTPNKKLPSRMWTLHKSFVQSMKGKAKEFIQYVDKIFEVLKAIKVRFKQFDLAKYEILLREIIYTTINKIKEA